MKKIIAVSALVGVVQVAQAGFGDFLSKTVSVVTTADQIVNNPTSVVQTASTPTVQPPAVPTVQTPTVPALAAPAVADVPAFTEVKDISMEKLHKLAKKDHDLVIIDVRSAGEFASGHIPRAKNIPVGVIGQRISSVVPNKATPIYLYCLSGGRAGTAGDVLLGLGYRQVYNAGSVNAWPGKLK